MFFCKKSTKYFAESIIIYTFASANGKVLYGQLPSNPPGLDRSKGSWL